MRKHNIIRTLFAAAILSVFTCISAFAKDPDTAFLRVKIDYEAENKEVMPLPDESFSIAEKWKKDGDYWYYEDPIKNGTSVEFLKSVQIPHNWDSQSAEKDFSIIIYADAAENVKGTAAWDGEINDKDGKYSSSIKLDLTLNEYELDENGNYVPYVNGKFVLPGDKIEKHVFLDVNFSYRPSSSGGGGGGSSSSTPKEPTKIVYPIVPVKPDADPLPEIPQETTEHHKLSDTGDHSNTILYLIAAIISLSGVILIVIKKRKED